MRHRALVGLLLAGTLGCGVAQIGDGDIGSGADATATAGAVGTVNDLSLIAVDQTSVTLQLTEVDEGTGAPADYETRFASPAISWGSAAHIAAGSCVNPMIGTAVGATRTCTVAGL